MSLTSVPGADVAASLASALSGADVAVSMHSRASIPKSQNDHRALIASR